MNANSPWLELFRKERRAESKRRKRHHTTGREAKMNIQFPVSATTIAYTFQDMEQKVNERVLEEWVRLCKKAILPMPELCQTPLQIDFTGPTSMVFHNAAGVMWALPILHAIHQTNALDRAKLIIAIAPTSDSVDKELKAVYETLANIEETVSRIGTQTREMASVVAPMTAKRTRNRDYTNPDAAKMHRDMLASCRLSKVPNKRYMWAGWEDYAAFERHFLETNMRALPSNATDAPAAPKRFVTEHFGIICDGSNTYGPASTMFVPLDVQHMFNRTKSNFTAKLAEFERANPGVITPEMHDFMLRAKT